MKITNSTKNTVIADSCSVADNFITRFIGLMGRHSLPTGHGLIIKPCKQIHMFFMKFSLDVLFVNLHGEIVHIEESIKPWRVSKFIRDALYVVELPSGTAAGTHTKCGDKLLLEEYG